MLHPPSPDIPPWLHDHPHVATSGYRSNTVYVAAPNLRLDGADASAHGAGLFPTFRPELQLTEPGGKMSIWLLPSWFAPRAGRPPLGFHGATERWSEATDQVRLASVARGQEFVLDAEHYPEAVRWAADLIAQRH